jgi:hypothetical protein
VIEMRLIEVATRERDVDPVDIGEPLDPREYLVEAADRGSRNVTMRLDAIRSLERRRDSVRNGAAIGAGIGAGFGGAMFTYASVIDRNEMDEWAPLYVGAAAVYTGIGALIGWASDAASSKPHITFELSFQRKTKVSVQPVYLRGRGIALAVSF